MKRVEAFFQFGKLEPVVEALEKAGVTGLTVFYARGRGPAEREQISTSRGTKLDQQFYNLIDCIVTIVEDDQVEKIIDAIKNNANSTSKGIITISDVSKIVKI